MTLARHLRPCPGAPRAAEPGSPDTRSRAESGVSRGSRAADSRETRERERGGNIDYEKKGSVILCVAREMRDFYILYVL